MGKSGAFCYFLKFLAAYTSGSIQLHFRILLHCIMFSRACTFLIPLLVISIPLMHQWICKVKSFVFHFSQLICFFFFWFLISFLFLVVTIPIWIRGIKTIHQHPLIFPVLRFFAISRQLHLLTTTCVSVLSRLLPCFKYLAWLALPCGNISHLPLNYCLFCLWCSIVSPYF